MQPEAQKKEIENIRKDSQEHADKEGFLLQPDKKLLDVILMGLLNNEIKYSARYCPCRRISGDKEEDRKIICPCIYHKDEVKEDRHCKCFLFLSKKTKSPE